MSARSFRRSHEREARRRGRRLARRTAGAAAAVAAAAVVTAPGAEAANFTVSNLNNAGAGSLRQAVLDANGAAGPDTITFTGAATSGEIILADEIPISDDLTISGPGAQLAVSGDSNDNGVPDFATSAVSLGDTRIFNVDDPTSPGSPLEVVSISGLTLKEGVADDWPGSPQSEPGGAILANNVDLRLSNVTMTDNVATEDGGAVSIGGNESHLSVADSTLTGNRAKQEGGAIRADTGKYFGPSAPADFGTAITGSRIADNVAGGTDFGAFGYDPNPEGGGFATKYGTALISDSTITGNAALTAVGGDVDGQAGGLSLRSRSRVVDSTISGNTAGRIGGGALISGARLLSTTVSGNTAVNGAGGGVLATPGGPTGGVSRIDESTISGNAADATTTVQPFYGAGGGVATYGVDDSLQVRNSTIAANTGAARAGGVFAFLFTGDQEAVAGLQGTIVADNVAAGAPNDLGTVSYNSGSPVDATGGFAAGFSLIENPANVVVAGAPSGTNITGVDPKLAPLAANGGPTETQALSPTSVAIDSAQANGFSTDQRGSTRPVDSVATNATLSDGTDIGAFEVQDANATGGDPDTAFTKKPKKKKKLKGKKKKAKLKVKFNGTINSGAPGPLSFECKLDKGRFKPCSSPRKLKLKKGKHKFQVRAIDSTGRVDNSPAKAKIKIKKKKHKKGKK